MVDCRFGLPVFDTILVNRYCRGLLLRVAVMMARPSEGTWIFFE